MKPREFPDILSIQIAPKPHRRMNLGKATLIFEQPNNSHEKKTKILRG
jgi:hypothetical protein